jgi:hypothetical protein
VNRGKVVDAVDTAIMVVAVVGWTVIKIAALVAVVAVGVLVAVELGWAK